MRPFLARLLLLACMLTAVIGCSNDATTPDAGSSHDASVRDDAGDTNQPPVDGGTITGRVYNDADGDGFADFNEFGVSNVIVTLRRSGGGGPSSLGSQRTTHTSGDGSFAFEPLTAGTYQLSVAASSRSSSTTAPLEVVLTETNGEVSDFLHADLGVLAKDDQDDQGGDDDRLVVGAYIRVLGDFLPDSNVLLAINWNVVNCEGDQCIVGVLRGPITFIDDRTKSFAVMGTLMRAGEQTFPLYARVGQRADVVLHDAGVGDDFIADLVSPFFSLQEEIRGRIESVTFDGNSARLVVLDTAVVIHGLER